MKLAPILAAALLLPVTFAAQAAGARLETSDIVAYYESIKLINMGLSRQDAADFNFKLTLLTYGPQPVGMTDDEYANGLVTYLLQSTDNMLEKLAPYDGWTAEEIMALD